MGSDHQTLDEDADGLAGLGLPRVDRDRVFAGLFDEAPAPRTFGRFQILGRLGQGGMGTVLEAYDPNLDRKVAIKHLHAENEGRHAARLLREAHALARLSHPNVVQVFETGEADRRLFIAMELVRGRTLWAWQQQQRHGWRECLEVYMQAGRGLAAAHAEGIIHRDFKPSNCIIDNQRRVKVLDFGLARGQVEPADANEFDRRGTPDAATSDAEGVRGTGDGVLDRQLTRTGTMLGTPAYVAPEQFGGARADARADQYSFCVALYEAIYGARPDPRDDAPARVQDKTSAVPRWLGDVLSRGLAEEPEARYPTMDALLEALAKDPALVRRRRLRVLGLVVLTAVAVVTIVWGVGAIARRLEHHRREAAAARIIAGFELRALRLRDRGEHVAAVEVFDEGMDERSLEGTEVVADAWLREADRRGEFAASNEGLVEVARSLEDSVVAGYARAYTTAKRDDQQLAALLGLGRVLRTRSRWDELGRLTARVEREHPDILAQPDVARLRFDAALGLRELDKAYRLASSHDLVSPEARTILEGLRFATRMPGGGAIGARVDPVGLGDAGGQGFLVQDEGDVARIEARVLRDLSTPPLQSVRTDWKTHAIPVFDRDGVLPFIVTSTLDAPFNLLLHVDENGAFEEVARWNGGTPLSTAATDLDADGQPEIYVGEGPPLRQLQQLERDDDGRWHARVIGSSRLTMNSDVNALLATDLDGDGAAELTAAFGPWGAYDVRVLELAGSGDTLRTRARLKMGMVRGLQVLRRATGQTRLVVAKRDEYPNAVVFPPDRPMGEPEGVYTLALRGDALEIDEMLVPGGYNTVQIADVSGNGLDDVVLSRQGFSVILVQDASGALTPLQLPEMSAKAVEADGDPAAELVATVMEYDQTGQVDHFAVWIAGMGDEPCPSRTLAPRRGEGERGSDEFEARAVNTEQLAEIGLVAEAAHSYVRIAGATEVESDQALARLRAARLHESLGRVDRSTPLYLEAASEPRWTADALAGALRGTLDETQGHEALALIDRVPAQGQVSAQHEARLSGLRAQLRALVDGENRIDLRFDRPLPLAWSVGDSRSLRRTAAQDVLRVDAFGPTTLLSLPVEYAGGSLSIEIDLGVDRLEWGASLALMLVHDDNAEFSRALSVSLEARGGGGVVEHCLHVALVAPDIIECVDDLGPAMSETTPPRVMLRAAVLPDAQTQQSSIRIGDRTFAREVRGFHPEPPPPGRYRLVLETRGEALAAVGASIHAIHATGLRARAAGDDTPRAALARALADDQLGRAIRLDDPDQLSTTADAITRVDLWLRAGRFDRARDLLRQQAEVRSDPELLAGLRRSPQLYRPVLASLDEREVFTQIRDAWSLAWSMHPRDPRLMQELLEMLADLDRHLEWVVQSGADVGLARLEVALDLLDWRGSILGLQGEYDRALADLNLAVELTRTKLPDPLAERSLSARRMWLQLDLATFAAQAGDEIAAARYLHEAWQSPSRPEFFADFVAARPALRGVSPGQSAP